MLKAHTRRRGFLWLVVVVTIAGYLSWQHRVADPDSTHTAVVQADRTLLDRSPPQHDSARAAQSRGADRTVSSAPWLFSFVQPPDAGALDQALPAPAAEIHYVQVDAAMVSGKRSPFWRRPGAGRIGIPLPQGGTAIVAIESSEMLGPDRFTSVGRIEGRPGSRVLFSWNEGFLHASIEDPGRGNFALRAATLDLSQFYQVDPSRVPPCGGARRPDRDDAVRRRSAAMPPGGGALTSVQNGNAAGAPHPQHPQHLQHLQHPQHLQNAGIDFTLRPAVLPPLAAAENPQRAEVHVMMLYTPSVLPTLAGTARAAAVQSAFDLAIAKVNSAFEASLITARVKLVRVAETAYDESVGGPSQVQDAALTALYQESDGRMDEIHALRDAAGADIVCLALNRADPASSGLSFLLDVTDDATNPGFAFSVVQYSNVTGTNVVPHELGHVFGCAHDRENAMSGAGAFSYSYGYRFLGADGRQYHDIMAYPPGTELGYYSNPVVLVPEPVNAAIGIPAGRPGESNSALTIERTAFSTSGYRLQTQAAASAGSLINVATRAFVGTGDNVMIGGFVVQGLQPKRMLIRAAGPALRLFGVDDALADPTLRVFADGAMTAENDNWGQPVGPGTPALAAEISTAAGRASAFSFPAGSADAAVLVTLPPGAYTAIVEGRDGGTGQGLVEAYEMERDVTRIVNLATRAYAGRDGLELVGGFVVEGSAGATKRILIRVLGPTLGRAPFNMTDTLDDPEMEVRNSAGELLIKNDDWSSGADGGPSQDNDFRPLVDLYGEKQIFATGLAPTNRREPCVLVDLPPGSYTVTIRPYELRSSNPLRDQPAIAGVGIIEVFEINQ